MSVQFGRWNFEDQPPAPDYIEKVSATLAPYGPDSNESYSKGGVKIFYRAFYTTKESHREAQPHISPAGAVITWDGRLDNRAEIISELRDILAFDSTDVAIVAVAYEKWGISCFAKLIGDWALSIWNPNNRSLTLAKDPVGTHHLYYSIDKDQITWSTILDPLVLFAGKTFAICEEYFAGWFPIMLPATHLTPYTDIYSVPPSSSVLLRPGKHTVSKYWDFDPRKRIRYRTDAEYEEHFRAALSTAVRRRLRSDRPVLAELSGGMDSSSIVCMADTLVAGGAAETPRVDTISWYDDFYDHIEPDWNELHWITKVEQKRGRAGYHIHLGALTQKELRSQRPFVSDFETGRFAATPNPGSRLGKLFQEYSAYIKSQGYRVTLSGIGGDDPTGNLPTPRQELQNLLARAKFFTLAYQLNAWAIKMRKSRLRLLWQAVRGFFPPPLVRSVPKGMRPAPWFHPGFVHRNHAALCGYPSRLKLFGPLPSFEDNIDKLEDNRRFLGTCSLWSELLRDIRYPYLDRDLLEFLFAVPREQIVGVGQRRFLMKRALVGVVPDELLKRKRKPLPPPKDCSTEWPSLAEIGEEIVGSSVGIVDSKRLLEALQKARRNEEIPVHSLRCALTFEFWLRHLTTQRVLKVSTPRERQNYPRTLEAKELQASALPKSSAS